MDRGLFREETNMASLLEEIAPAIAQLAKEKGLRVISKHHYTSVFGNAVIEMASTDFDLRVIRDRGHVTLEVSASGKGEWHNLENVLAFVVGQSNPSNTISSAQALSVNFRKVAALMTSDLSEVGFLTFEKQQSAAFLKKLFP
jgi:hypothetical protein